MNDENQKIVWVTCGDNRKDLSEAKKYGKLIDVFTFAQTKNETNGDELVAHARKALAKVKPGDYVLPIGDPSLVGICMAVMLENIEELHVLRWNREEYTYNPLTLNFSWT